ncbi:threonylcarbamoyl-AMP synthase [bacterium]|nr:MAG: threonylcarbamoyl-AMP synthase [bacterium]
MVISSQEAVNQLKKGKAVAIPTETVYGLAASAFNLSAIESIFEIKGRPSDNPLIVHINSIEQLNLLVKDVSDEARTLIQAFWPGPLTLLFPKKDEVLDKITAGLPNVAVRMPEHPIALEIIQETGPLVAPSANRSGSPSPTRVEHVLSDYNGFIPVVDGGKCQVGIESTVLSLLHEPITILRPGKISKEHIEFVLHKPVEVATMKESHEKVMSPGMKYTHYSPKAKVRWMNTLELEGEFDKKSLYLHVFGSFNSEHHKGFNRDFNHFSRELFDQFRKADEQGFPEIAIEPFRNEDHEMASALLNRIQKAMGV